MKKKVREYFPYQLSTLVAMVPVILPQNSANFLPFSLIIGPIVILGEKPWAWRIFDHHEFLPW